MLIVDEVHNLEEKQRANMTKTINSKTVINKIKGRNEKTELVVDLGI